jgi:hypothetical protein
MTRAIVQGCWLLLALGCGHNVEDPTFPVPDELGSHHVVHEDSGSAVTQAPPERATGRYHMHRQVDDLRDIERLLVRGKLVEAKALAFMLSRAVPPGRSTSHGAAQVSAAALALAGARSLEEACRLEPLVGEACAGCHRRPGSRPMFEAVPPAPPNDATAEATMARHRWAVDRVWEGFVGPSDRPWREGLEVFATTRFPTPVEDGAGQRLQVVARDALAAMTTDTQAARARTYGELLVTCRRCHDKTIRPSAITRR